MAKKGNKKGFGSRITGSLVGAGTGAIIQVAEGAIGKSNFLNYGMLVAGACLSAFVPGKMTETAGDVMVGVAGYRIAQNFGLGSTVTGLGLQRQNIGNVAHSNFRNINVQKKNSEQAGSKATFSTLG